MAIMPHLLIIPSDADAAICLPDMPLPSFYMEDYTVLGLKVGDLEAAAQLLKNDGIHIFEGPNYSQLSLEHRQQIPHIIRLLKANDISCEFADVVEQVYQG
jgi:hypothetical protein